MKLGYWKIRGLAQPIRLLLEYAGEKYEDKQYVCGPAPDFDRSEWLNEKEKLDLDFPNLPYLIDGETRITQSNAVLRYLARKHALVGKTETEIVRVDMVENQAMDMRMALTNVVYSPDFKDLRAEYLETAKKYLTLFSKFLGEHPWFAGQKMTFVDFLVYELLDVHKILESSLLEPYDNLNSFIKRFEELDSIKRYMASDRFMKAPLNDRTAFFNN